jgi:hypothetical protein
LFRPADQGALETLGRRLVAYAAIHAEAFDAWVKSAPARDWMLANVDAAAPTWWKRLLADDGFNHLRGSVPYFWPTPMEIEGFGSNPAGAWMPFRELIVRAQRRGAEVLEASAIGSDSG